MSDELAEITNESELIAFLQSIRATVDEGLTNLGVDPDDDVAGFGHDQYQSLKIGMPGLDGHLVGKLGGGFTRETEGALINGYCPVTKDGSCTGKFKA